MASVEKRTGKRGTSYRITVTVGRNASGKMLRHYKTFTPPETWGEAKAEREAQRQACVLRKRLRKALRWITARRLKNTPGMFLN